MVKILIVEGNTSEIILKNRKAGNKLAWERYRDALSLHEPEAEFLVTMPYAADLMVAPVGHDDIDAIALTGSGVMWSANDAEAIPYLEYLGKLVETGKPIIGSCWGMQTMVQLMGGIALPNSKGAEIGFAEDISLTEAGRSHWIFDGMPDQFHSPCIHRDHVVELPDCFDLLASNMVSHVQAVACHNSELDFVGFQFHPEFDLDYAKALFEDSTVFVGAKKTIKSFPEDLPDSVTDEMKRTKVFGNWLQYVKGLSVRESAAA
ncbi:MAG: type 1 glutamine amidotransferase [Pseudomonadota bacterium]